MYAFCRLKEEQAFGIIGWCYPSCLYWQIILHDLILDILDCSKRSRYYACYFLSKNDYSSEAFEESSYRGE
jgi:hypothetical protein